MEKVDGCRNASEGLCQTTEGKDIRHGPKQTVDKIDVRRGYVAVATMLRGREGHCGDDAKSRREQPISSQIKNVIVFAQFNKVLGLYVCEQFIGICEKKDKPRRDDCGGYSDLLKAGWRRYKGGEVT
jgi:hypothetical protein